MGRPWWYDNYYEKQQAERRKRFRFPGGKVLTWVVLLLVVALITWIRVRRF